MYNVFLYENWFFNQYRFVKLKKKETKKLYSTQILGYFSLIKIIINIKEIFLIKNLKYRNKNVDKIPNINTCKGDTYWQIYGHFIC